MPSNKLFAFSMINRNYFYTAAPPWLLLLWSPSSWACQRRPGWLTRAQSPPPLGPTRAASTEPTSSRPTPSHWEWALGCVRFAAVCWRMEPRVRATQALDVSATGVAVPVGRAATAMRTAVPSVHQPSLRLAATSEHGTAAIMGQSVLALQASLRRRPRLPWHRLPRHRLPRHRRYNQVHARRRFQTMRQEEVAFRMPARMMRSAASSSS